MGGWHERPAGPQEDRGGRLAFGILLMALGAAFLASQQLHVDLGSHGWPALIIVPGLFLLLAGLAVPGEAGLGMSVPGAIVATVGLLLAFQDSTGAWASWTYAWALVAPGSVGVALAAHGILHRRADLLEAGLRTAATGLALFTGFGLFFESILGIDSEQHVPVLQDAFPVLAIVLGALIVLIALLPRSGPDRDRL